MKLPLLLELTLHCPTMMWIGLCTAFSTIVLTSHVMVSAGQALMAVSCWVLVRPPNQRTVTSVITALGDPGLLFKDGGGLVFTACWAADVYEKDLGTRCTAPWIPGSCVSIPLPLFLFLL